MTLYVPEPSTESIAAVQERLSELAGRTEFRGRALTQANPLDVGLAAPHDVYSLGLDQLAAGASLDEARPVGRRFLVMEGERPVASAEVADPEDGSGFQANEGPFVAATADAIARAEEDPRLADGRYELRLLRVPALYLMALWLKDEDGGGDLLIPLDPAPPPFEAGQAVPPEKLLAELSGQARARLAQDGEKGEASS